MTYRIESIDGITAGPYPTEKAAERAAKHANSIAPWQHWRAVPEDEITGSQP
jgi:hypothetical protein